MDPQRFFPFTEKEMENALALIMPREAAAAAAAQIYHPQEDSAGFTLMGDTLVLLAVASEDAARRVVELRPDLRETVERIRRDPEAFLRELNEQ